MSNLPKLDLPHYTHHLVGIDRKIKYRPFTNKEQKILLNAKEEEDSNLHVEAIMQILELCTLGEVDVSEMPFFDIEDLFVRIRSKSVNEEVSIKYKVKDSDEKVEVVVNLDDLKVTVPEDHSKKIMLTDSVGLVMKYPTLEMLQNRQDEDTMLKKCIDYVFDNDEVYHFNDFTDEEVESWMDQFDLEIMKRIYKFFETMPRIRYETEVELKDGTKETIKLEGIEDLFT